MDATSGASHLSPRVVDQYVSPMMVLISPQLMTHSTDHPTIQEMSLSSLSAQRWSISWSQDSLSCIRDWRGERAVCI
ncbi:hypothetical protein FRC03_003484 [Tulasnella sp. 419]|nr:hypothetical protein FRC03_003484 [Tulasnella sp. 419]